ncbi:MAG: ATP-binding response regulator, partial [Hyphomicrobiaceae bacterium]
VEYEPLARGKGLDLRVVATSLWVRSDRRLLRRVLQNLVSNAVKYTQTGGVLLGARRRSGMAVVQVTDTGPGIPASQQSLIFKEFVRLQETAGTVRGLGLGLSIVERIGKVLDVSIALASVPGKGSTFSVALPAAPPQAAIRTQDAPVPAPAAAKCLMLCLDNEPAVPAGLKTLLEGWGCRVLGAQSLEQALAMVGASADPPDLILADYHLDIGTGLDAIAAVRRLAGSEIPAVVMTADRSPQIQSDVRRLGLGLLHKPLKAAALRALLSQTVLRRAAAE